MGVVLKKNDLLPTLRATLTDAAGAPVDLSGATVVFRLRPKALVIGDLKFEKPATILDAVTGRVEYTWEVGDLDTVGYFAAEFVATLAGKPLTSPGSGYIFVSVEPNIGA